MDSTFLQDPQFPSSALLCRSAESALFLALRACGAGSEDYVLTPNLGSTALAGALARTGAAPIMMDADPGSWLMDMDLLEEFLMGHTMVNDDSVLVLRRDGKPIKAVIAVHLNGNPADLDRLRFITHRFFLPLIEDGSEAAGSTYRGRAIGSFGELGVLTLSQHPAGYDEAAGLLLATEEDLLKKANLEAANLDVHEIPHWVHLDVNRLPMLQQQRESATPLQRELRDEIAHLPTFTLQEVHPKAEHHFSTLAIETDSAPELHGYLSEQGILTTTLAAPLSDLPSFRRQLYIRRDDHSRRLFEHVVRIPGIDRMHAPEQLRLAEAIRNYATSL